MADPLTVLGAVSSVIQLVDFTTKVFERVNHYIRRVDEAPETLRDIGIHLPLFIDALRRIQFHIDFGHFNPQTSSALQILTDECYSQMIALDDLMTKLTPELGDSKLTKTRKAILSLKEEKTLERIFSKVSGYIKMLLLYQNSVTSTHTMVNTKLVLKQVENASSLETTMSIDSVSTTGDSRSLSTENSAPRMASKTLANYSNQKKQRRISYFMSLARFGLLWAFQADLDLSWGNYGFSISPNLHFQQLVKNTSPGFQLVYKCRFRQIDIQTACNELFKLFQRGVISPWDNFPDGATWLERLLGWSIYNPHKIFEFVKVLCNCGASIKAKTPLLSLVASFNDYGMHLILVKELLASGYDCSLDTSYADPWGPWFARERLRPFGFCNYPRQDGESEPFLLRFLKECSKNAYGVWGQTPLMDSILCGSKTEISKFLEYPRCLQGKNALGQTAFHLAVLRPEVLSLLLEAHSDFGVADFNEPDSYGNSPLSYAAAYGCTESVRILLGAGANPLKEGHLEFIQWALFWNHWDVAAEALTFLRAIARASDTFIQTELLRIMAALLGHPPSYRKWPLELLKKMFTLGVDKHMLLEGGKTLLHYAPDSEWIDHLFDAGFHQIDHRNIKGETALMTFMPDRTGRVGNILARGCDVNHRNNRGETALQKAYTEGTFRYVYDIHNEDTVTPNSYRLESISSDLAVIAKLLHQGADTSILDDCRCPCAPDGCSAILQLLHQGIYNPMCCVWVLECLLMLNEIQGQTIAQKALFEIDRVQEFELADMTHVCCRGGSIIRESMDDAEVDEIIDEENEFVAILEETMRTRSFNPDNESVEASWLSLIGDFWTRDRWFRREKYWRSWDPTTGRYAEQPPLTTYLRGPYNTTSMDVIRIDEEEDRYWLLMDPTKEYTIPQSSVYSAWVEWVYQNPEKYDYPLPVDRDWYEKRKYWATRQAEVLERLS